MLFCRDSFIMHIKATREAIQITDLYRREFEVMHGIHFVSDSIHFFPIKILKWKQNLFIFE